MIGEIFVIGNAPSINDYDLNRLEGRDTFVCNRFYLYKDLTWKPTYYTVADEGVLFDYWDEVMEYAATAKRSFFPNRHPAGNVIEPLVDLNNVTFYELKWGGFSLGKLPLTVGLNGTVANVMMQLSFEMDYTTIYLLGVDIDYKITDTMVMDKNSRDMYSTGEDPNHFSKEYFGKGHHFHYPKSELMLKQLTVLSDLLGLLGVKVVNLSKTSNFTTCEHADFDEVTA